MSTDKEGPGIGITVPVKMDVPFLEMVDPDLAPFTGRGIAHKA